MSTTVIREHSQGLLKDGRRFEIIDFRKLAIGDDGIIHDGLVGIIIDNKYITCNITNLAKNIDYENQHK